MTKIKLCVRYLYARYSNRHHYSLHAGTFMPALLLFSLFCSCRPSHQSTHPFERFSLQTTALLRNPNFASSPQLIHHIIDSLRLSERDTSFPDLACNRYYAERHPYLWINRLGVDKKADTILSWLSRIEEAGISPSKVYVKQLKEQLQRIRTLQFGNPHGASRSLAYVEYYLTRSCLRYACGQAFGFTNPYKMLNHLDHVDPDSALSPFRTLYDIPTVVPDDNFLQKVLCCIRTHHITGLMEEVQPRNSLYTQLQTIYKQKQYSPRLQNTIAVNMERARWRTPEEQAGTILTVNLPSQMLLAYSSSCDSSCSMRVCIGTNRHKTPLLYSHLSRIDLNPYWIIPPGIIRREIIPNHLGDTSYFQRNHYHILHCQTLEEISPMNITSAMLKSGQYIIRQDRGETNSLGRIIFRFPNSFSVYLHDTDNKAAFARKSRLVSHGCIRLEHPMSLVKYLLGYKGPKFIERIEESVSSTEDDLNGNGSIKPLKSIALEKDVAIHITYFTCLPSPLGDVNFYHDIYDYDDLIARQIF